MERRIKKKSRSKKEYLKITTSEFRILWINKNLFFKRTNSLFIIFFEKQSVNQGKTKVLSICSKKFKIQKIKVFISYHLFVFALRKTSNLTFEYIYSLKSLLLYLLFIHSHQSQSHHYHQICN